jgi:hypothetical protein
MKKKAVLELLLLAVVVFSVHSQQYNNENDFDFKISNSLQGIRINRYIGTSKTVRIPPKIQNLPVKSIEDGAFESMELISVVIPDTVLSIGRYAFSESSGQAMNTNRLTSIIIPDSVKRIDTGAFANNQLINVNIGNGVNIILDYAFAGNKITNITIPNSVVSIGVSAFANNPLTRVTIPSSVSIMRGFLSIDDFDRGIPPKKAANPFPFTPSLEYISVDPTNKYFVSIDGVLYSDDRKILYAYPSAKGDAYTIPNGVTEIASRAFAGSQIERISLPNSLEIIGEGAFMRANLSSIDIPNSVTKIDGYAFFENRLTTVTIPNNIYSIGTWAFAMNQLTSITIPNNVSTIEYYAFGGNSYLTSITIGADVTLGGKYGDAFDNGFDDFYNRNGKKAGTYTYSRNRWSRR